MKFTKKSEITIIVEDFNTKVETGTIANFKPGKKNNSAKRGHETQRKVKQ